MSDINNSSVPQSSVSADQNWFLKHKALSGCLGCFGLFIAITVLGAIAGSNSDSNSATNTNTNTETNESSQTAAKKEDIKAVAYKLGDKVVVNEVEWVLSSAVVKTSLKKSFTNESAKTDGKFIVLTGSVKNNSKDMKTFTDIKIYDDMGREYTHSSETFEGLGEKQVFLLSNINPGLAQKFADVYEVPSDAKDFRAKVGDLNFFAAKEEYIDLGF